MWLRRMVRVTGWVLTASLVWGISGCGGDVTPKTLNEPCTRTEQCIEGLECLSGVCLAPDSSVQQPTRDR
ncbi:MAG: EB domain-containing protein [Myxococcota bacterium]